jgi:hypothetical protein
MGVVDIAHAAAALRCAAHLLANQRPQLVKVDNGAVVVVLQLVEVPHTDLFVCDGGTFMISQSAAAAAAAHCSSTLQQQSQTGWCGSPQPGGLQQQQYKVKTL